MWTIPDSTLVATPVASRDVGAAGLLRWFSHDENRPSEQRSHGAGAGDENRTRVISLEDWSSTIELHPHGVLRPTRCAVVREAAPKG